LTAAIGILGAVAGYLFSAIKRGKSSSDMAEEKQGASMSVPIPAGRQTESGGAGEEALPQRSGLPLMTEE